MERVLYERRGDRTERWLRLMRNVGIAVVGAAALAGLARDLTATRGPIVAWIIVTLLGGAGGLFAWSLLEARTRRRDALALHTLLVSEDERAIGELTAYEYSPLLSVGYFPNSRGTARDAGAPRARGRRGRAHSMGQSRHLRRSRMAAPCAVAHARRHRTSAPRRRPSARA